MEQILNYTVRINNECHLNFSNLVYLTMLYHKKASSLIKRQVRTYIKDTYSTAMASPLILNDTNITTFFFNVFEGVNGIPQKLLSCNMVLLLC